jgi:hypothetical protein
MTHPEPSRVVRRANRPTQAFHKSGRRPPASYSRRMSATAASVLQQRLGLSDDELLAVLDADPLELVAGDLEHRPELGILLALTDEPAQRLGTPMLQRWLRTNGPAGRPLDVLTARDFPAFEDAISDLESRGFVIRGGRG